jgi:hypothetical protein
MGGTERTGVDPAASLPGQLSETEFSSLYELVRGQAPWGPDDRRGALNYLTPATVLAAVGEVRLGRTVSLAAPVETWITLDNPEPCQHEMTQTAGTPPAPGLSFALDRVAMNIHGNADSHIDALCHVIFDGSLYQGVPADTLTEAGAEELSMLAIHALGLHLMDYLDFAELTEACAAARRWSFLCVIAPLRLPTGTGSPVNPIAIL